MTALIRDAYRALRASLTHRVAKLAISALEDARGEDGSPVGIPSHIGFVMDGNRRYADTRGEKPIHGHITGYGTLLNVLRWCLELRVSTVSVYAFSIDNYSRSDEEVGLLMRLVEDRLGELEEEAPRLRRDGVKVRVLGDLSLAPSGVREAARRVMEATAANNTCVLNVFFSYTASEELVRAGRMVVGGRSRGGACAVEHIDAHLYAGEDVDLLIRTSGESRLSDFMLRQTRCCVLHFTDTLWPDFGLVDLLEAVMAYQRQVGAVRGARKMLEDAKLEALYEVSGPKTGNVGECRGRKDGSRSPSSVLSVEDG